MQIPEGYQPMNRSCPYWDLVGPFYERVVEGGVHLGVRVEEKHGNLRGVAQGGLIATLADVALGRNISYASEQKRPLATVNLTTDFAGAGQIGDWLEARVDVQRVGARLSFANAYIYAGDKRIARISGVFSAVG